MAPVAKDTARYLTDGKGLIGVGVSTSREGAATIGHTEGGSAGGPFCRSCGTKNDGDAAYCDSCGTALA